MFQEDSCDFPTVCVRGGGRGEIRFVSGLSIICVYNSLGPSSLLWGVLLDSLPFIVLSPVPQYLCMDLKINSGFGKCFRGVS